MLFDSPSADDLVFKGGTSLSKVFENAPAFTSLVARRSVPCDSRSREPRLLEDVLDAVDDLFSALIRVVQRHLRAGGHAVSGALS